MKVLNLTAVVAMASLSLTACNELSGTLTLKETLNVVDKKGRAVSVPKGNFASEFEYDQDDREIKLEIKDIDGKKDVDLKLRVPAGTQVPTHNGLFSLSGAEVGQNFNLQGELDTDVEVGPRTSGSESCTYTERDYVCDRVCYERVDRNGKKYRDCQKECGYQDVTHYGSREVEYHYVTTTVSVEAELTDLKDNGVLGELSVARSGSEIIYDYYGSCNRR